MDFGSIPSKIAGNSDKIGMAIGAWSYAGGVHAGDPLAGIMDIINGLMKNPHLPNLSHVMQNLMTYDQSKTFPTAIGAAIVGWLLKEIDIHPSIEKLGTILHKAGIGAAEASAVLCLLNFSGLSCSPGSGGGGSSDLKSLWGA